MWEVTFEIFKTDLQIPAGPLHGDGDEVVVVGSDGVGGQHRVELLLLRQAEADQADQPRSRPGQG